MSLFLFKKNLNTCNQELFSRMRVLFFNPLYNLPYQVLFSFLKYIIDCHYFYIYKIKKYHHFYSILISLYLVVQCYFIMQRRGKKNESPLFSAFHSFGSFNWNYGCFFFGMNLFHHHNHQHWQKNTTFIFNLDTYSYKKIGVRVWWCGIIIIQISILKIYKIYIYTYTVYMRL